MWLLLYRKGMQDFVKQSRRRRIIQKKKAGFCKSRLRRKGLYRKRRQDSVKQVGKKRIIQKEKAGFCKAGWEEKDLYRKINQKFWL